MSLPKDQAWFPAKTDGYGWTLPTRWQGWTVVITYIVVLMATSLLVTASTALTSVYFTLACTGSVIGICYWKGEAPRRRRAKPSVPPPTKLAETP